MVTAKGKRYRYTARGLIAGGAMSAIAVAMFFITGYGPWIIFAGVPTAIGLILGALADRKTDYPGGNGAGPPPSLTG